VLDWLTHAKPTGYDRAGNCVPKLSRAQIKARARQYLAASITKRKEEGARQSVCEGFCGEGWLDTILDIDPEYDMLDQQEGAQTVTTGRSTVVEAAQQVRKQQTQKERLPEANLLPIAHAKSPNGSGQLVVQGDPSMLLMI
jgi:hypothetical protein